MRRSQIEHLSYKCRESILFLEDHKLYYWFSVVILYLISILMNLVHSIAGARHNMTEIELIPICYCCNIQPAFVYVFFSSQSHHTPQTVRKWLRNPFQSVSKMFSNFSIASMHSMNFVNRTTTTKPFA